MEKVRKYSLLEWSAEEVVGKKFFWRLTRDGMPGETSTDELFPRKGNDWDEDGLTIARHFLQERGERIIGIAKDWRGFVIFTEPMHDARQVAEAEKPAVWRDESHDSNDDGEPMLLDRY